MNRAAQKLRQILEAREKGAYKGFAAEVGVQPDQLSKWLSAEHRPSLKYRLRISDLLGIGLRDWDDDVQEQAEGAA